jgi:DNA-binding XRE family transcriptional regulator
VGVQTQYFFAKKIEVSRHYIYKLEIRSCK